MVYVMSDKNIKIKNDTKRRWRTKKQLKEAITHKQVMRKRNANPFITPKMIRLVHLLTDMNDDRTLTQKCKDVPVSTTALYTHWLSNVKFLEFYREERMKMMSAYAHAVDKTLIRKAMKGKQPSMTKLYYQKVGELPSGDSGSLLDQAAEIHIHSNVPRPKKIKAK